MNPLLWILLGFALAVVVYLGRRGVRDFLEQLTALGDWPHL